MKKTVLNKNYSLLVLVLLILYLTYINIPDNLSMSGGDPAADALKLDLKLQKYSVLYKYLSKFIWVYVILVGALFGYAIYRLYYSDEMFFQGIPILGIPSNWDWDRQGSVFLPAFFNTAKLKYGLFTPGTEPSSPDVAQSFEDDAAKHIDNAQNRLAVDIFCNEVAPCNICHCQGPDPNYAGPVKNAPLIYYPGDKNNQCHPPSVAEKFINVVEYLDDPNEISPAAKIIKNQLMSGISEKHIGMIPNCCCELFHMHIKNTPLHKNKPDLQEINSTNIQALTSDKVKDSKKAYLEAGLLKAEIANDDTLVGLGAHASCESVTHTILVAVADTDGSDKLDSNGKKIYTEYGLFQPKGPGTNKKSSAIEDQVKSCNGGDANAIAKLVKTCKNYNADMAKGVSVFHAESMFNVYGANTIANASRSANSGPPQSMPAKASSITDISDDWTTNPVPNNNPSSIKPRMAQDWPGTRGAIADPDKIFAPELSCTMKTNYWYITGSGSPDPGKKIQLKIDTHLMEVIAKPLKELSPEISTNQITNGTVIDWLDSYVYQSGTRLSNGEYIFPPYTTPTL